MCLPSYITVKAHEHDKYIEPGFNDFVSQRFSIKIQHASHKYRESVLAYLEIPSSYWYMWVFTDL